MRSLKDLRKAGEKNLKQVVPNLRRFLSRRKNKKERKRRPMSERDNSTLFSLSSHPLGMEQRET